jgi:hypothetical protein
MDWMSQDNGSAFIGLWFLIGLGWGIRRIGVLVIDWVRYRKHNVLGWTPPDRTWVMPKPPKRRFIRRG